ncbi:mediator of RNA polymerase II transcription subunit 17-like [Ylistrum balloti]|uniref:mediator of RNA polymerase II transcription subunit 17-like n=1 Tax=Ylistrum balloti TaxID=509963 RepID=UPI002905B324|nr:mediator of RNA polymerase II transcription subunit 17-like [Ylistrum balloti]
MAAAGVNICVEAVQENQIQECRVVERADGDGQEIQEVYVQPLSMSENLSKLAHKIDFYKDESDDKKGSSGDIDKESEDKNATSFQPSLWPWDSVRNKIKGALTEMSVLLDVLNITKEKRYMILDQVSQPPPDPKTQLQLQLLSKKSALNEATNVLLNGAERLRRSQSEMGSKPQGDFHIELLKLRQNWRLKKAGKLILGDLSYKSAGSRYWQGGTFEVVKSTSVGEGSEASLQKGSLEVIIPSELEGVAYIQVEVKVVPEAMDLMSAILKIPSGLGTIPTDAYWQQKLEVAQNVLFCKEIFAQLAREAVQSKSSVPHLVVGNQIITNIFPGIQLSIVLCHSPGKDKDKKQSSAPHKLDHNHVLEHSLHQLLRELHYKNIHFSPPHPVTAVIGISKKRRLAGPNALSRSELTEMIENETLLHQIIKQTKHSVLRLRTMKTIDHYASTQKDPNLATHWNCTNNSLEASCRVVITSQGYDLRVWHSFVLNIGVDMVKAVTREGRVYTFSYEERELEDFIMWQISQHQLSVSQNLARMMGWQMLSTSTALGVGDMEDVGTASSLVLASPNHDRVLAIKSGPSSGVKVFLQCHSKDHNGKNRAVLKDIKWQSVGTDFQSVDLARFDGRSFASKFELLLAVLTRSSKG